LLLCFTSRSFPQSLDFTNFPSSINFKDWSSQVNGYGTWDLAAAPLSKESVFNYGPSYRGIDYSSTNGNYKTAIRIADQGGTKIVTIELRDTTVAYPEEQRLARTIYYGPSLTNLVMGVGFDAGLMNPYGFSSPPPSNFGPDNFVNGFNADGTAPLGGAAPSSGGSSSSGSSGSSTLQEQAVQSTDGLILQNGEFHTLHSQ